MITVLLLALISGSNCYKSIQILRHGARDPDVWTEVDTKYLWTDYSSILTQKGVDQLIKTGQQQQRSEIFDSQGKCIYERLELQSSKTARCTSSAVCFIIGLCPKNYAEILHTFFRNYYSKIVLNQKKFEQILASDFSDPLALDYDIFDKTGDFLFQGHKTAQCPNLKSVNKAVENSSAYKQQEVLFKQMDGLNGVFDIMVEAYPSKTIKKSSITLTDIDDIYDDTFCNQFQGFNFPDPSLATFEYMSDVVKFLKYFAKNSEMFQHQAALSEPFKWIISQLYSIEPLSIYVGTESNQFAMLSVLTDERHLTPFSSQLEFIIKGDTVYVYFNKVQVKTKICENGYYCSIGETANFLFNYTVSDIKKFCGA